MPLSHALVWATKPSLLGLEIVPIFRFEMDDSEPLNFHDYEVLDIDDGPSFARHKVALAAMRRRGRSTRNRSSEDAEEHGDDDDEEDEGEDPDSYLVEDFQFWTNLHVYYRASDYGFLTEIQQGKRPISSFPERMNAYELFKDLAILVDKLRIHAVYVDPKTNEITVSEPEAYPCLLGQVATKITARGSDLLELCGLSPRFWHSDTRMVSVPWLGLTEEAQQAMDGTSYPQDIDASEVVLNDAEGDHDDNFYALWVDDEQEKVGNVVREKLVDWRHVRLSNFEGPQFHIGKRSRTGRWMGFIVCRDAYY